MKTSLTSGLKGDALKNVKAEFISSPVFRQRLEEVLHKKIVSNQKDMRSKDNLDNPNWALKTAFNTGYEAALIECINLLK